MIPYTIPLLPDFDAYTTLIKGIWERRYLTNNGPILIDFEKALAEYLEIENIACFVNGHLALECALTALELKGEVITTPFTFVSTIQAVINCGLTPVFCDIDPLTFNIDVAQIEKHITGNTSAILPVHVFGRPCDVEELEKIAQKYRLKLVYDAAHTFGVWHRGRALAGYGDISMISFHATKVFNSIEGGALIFRDPDLKNKLKRISNFGLAKEEAILRGTNAKMNEFSAAMGILNLSYAEQEIACRKLVFESYNQQLKNVPGIQTPDPNVHASKHNYSYYPLLIDPGEYGMDSDELFNHLLSHGVVTRRYFYPACNEMAVIKKLYPKANQTKIASAIAKRILTLPIHSGLTPDDITYICRLLKGK